MDGVIHVQPNVVYWVVHPTAVPKVSDSNPTRGEDYINQVIQKDFESLYLLLSCLVYSIEGLSNQTRRLSIR